MRISLTAECTTTHIIRLPACLVFIPNQLPVFGEDHILPTHLPIRVDHLRTHLPIWVDRLMLNKLPIWVDRLSTYFQSSPRTATPPLRLKFLSLLQLRLLVMEATCRWTTSGRLSAMTSTRLRIIIEPHSVPLKPLVHQLDKAAQQPGGLVNVSPRVVRNSQYGM